MDTLSTLVVSCPSKSSELVLNGLILCSDALLDEFGAEGGARSAAVDVKFNYLVATLPIQNAAEVYLVHIYSAYKLNRKK